MNSFLPPDSNDREMQQLHAQARQSFRETISIVRETTARLGQPPFDSASEHVANETWGVATMRHEEALSLLGNDLATRAVLDELRLAIDALAKLIS